jgi:phosphoglycerol transferase MdoB-like AlkP superfamily enzyme
MRERIRFMLIYFAFWAVYFFVARIIFLAYHIEDSKLLTLETVFGIFKNGFRMDLSMAAYMSIFPFLWVTFSNFIKKSVFQNTIFTYTLLLVFLITLIIVVDLEVYNIWSFRLDATPLNYLKSPREAWASVRSSPVLQLFISFIILILVSTFIVYRILANKIDNWKFIKHFPFVIYGVLITVALIIPIRGGLGIAPMNHSTVYFSKINFANISALNAPWNFFSSVFKHKSNIENPYSYLPKDALDETITDLYETKKGNAFVINKNIKKPNVLIIVWESFTQKVVDNKHNDIVVTPYFNKLKNDGIYFSNIYAMADRTDKALTSILSGYPAQPTESIIKQPVKSSTLPVLSKDFSKNGYATNFYYGGDTDFANIKSYLLNANFDKIVDKNDFPSEFFTSKWGVHDEHLFNKFIEDNKEVRNKPFFSTLLTLSSHEPFETTRDVVIKGDAVTDKFLNSMNYTDEFLGKFIETAKTQTWWSNTLVIIIADHGHRLPENGNKIDEFKIPMLWTGGVVKSNFKYDKIASQIDIASTLFNQLSIKSTDYTWSKNIFNASAKPWAFFVFNDGFGYVKPNKFVIFDNVGKTPINSQGKILPEDLIAGKAMQQKTFQDYLNR